MFVIRANGVIEKVRVRNIFNRNVALDVGDTVVVPRQLSIDDPLLEGLLPIAKILSDMAFTAAALESLKN